MAEALAHGLIQHKLAEMAIRTFAASQAQPSSQPCRTKRNNPGIQVISEMRMASVAIFPSA